MLEKCLIIVKDNYDKLIGLSSQQVRMGSTCEELKYTVEDWSSYSSHYHPKNIMDDRKDSNSRWTSANTSLDQFILLKLVKPGILRNTPFFY